MQKEQLIATDAEPTKEQLRAQAVAAATEVLNSDDMFVLVGIRRTETGSDVSVVAACDERAIYDSAVALTSTVGAMAIGDAGMAALPSDASQALALVAGLRSLQTYATEAAKHSASLQPSTPTEH